LARFFDRILPAFRSNPFNNPAYPMTVGNVNAFLEMFGGQNRSDAGEVVNPHTAMHTSTVWACIQLISTQIAINPLFMYQIDKEGNKSMATDHDYYDLITNRPNPEMDAIAFRTAVQIQTLIWGNGYIEIQRDNANRVVALWPRHAARTNAVRNPATGELEFRTTDSEDGKPRYIKNENMIHIIGLSFDGIVGIDVISYAKQKIGSKIAMDKFGARYFANYAMPQLAITSKQIIKPETKAQMRTSWEELQTGHNQHRVAILDNDIDIKQLSTTPEAAQYLESMKATEEEIAAIFGVPGSSIGLLDKGIKANVEQQAQNLFNYCLRPWMAKWEKALTSKMFSQLGRSAGRYVVKFDTRELIMPDASSRQAYYQSMIQNGVLSPNEVRSLEGLNSIGPLGDLHIVQLNMQTLDQLVLNAPEQEKPDAELTMEVEENSFPKTIGQTYRGLFKDGVTRVVKQGNRDTKCVYRCLWPTLDALCTAARSSSAYTTEPVTPQDECAKAVADLLKGFQHRASAWTEENIDQICTDELKRVAKALIFAVHRDEASAKARKDIEALEGDTEIDPKQLRADERKAERLKAGWLALAKENL
jgi:HK97 family phage portal protein